MFPINNPDGGPSDRRPAADGCGRPDRCALLEKMPRLETPMTSDQSLQFLEHLRRHDHLTKPAASNGQPTDQGAASGPQSKLWELTSLSASDFADEAARFAGLERVTLQELLSAPALNETFSQRFLREMAVFPYQAEDGSAALAVADPTDTAAPRAAPRPRPARPGAPPRPRHRARSGCHDQGCPGRRPLGRPRPPPW